MDINTIIQRNYESCKDMKMDPVDNTELVRMSTPFCQLLWLSRSESRIRAVWGYAWRIPV